MLSTTTTNISFNASCVGKENNAGIPMAQFNASYSGDRIYFSLDVAKDADMDHVISDFMDFQAHVIEVTKNL